MILSMSTGLFTSALARQLFISCTPHSIEYSESVIPFGFFGYFVLKLPSELCIRSFPCPPDSCIITALINSTYSPIPYCFAYLRISGSYDCTPALTGLTVVEFSPPIMEMAAPKSNTITITSMAIHPPAAIVTNSAFVPTIIAFATETVVFAAALTTFSVAFSAVFADFSAAFRNALAVLYAFFAACFVVFIVETGISNIQNVTFLIYVHCLDFLNNVQYNIY